MPNALRSASRTRLLILFIAALFGISIFVQQMYFARRVHAAGFTAGNIVVYRVGDGSAALGSTAAAVFLDEYTPGGALVQSIPMPTAVVGSNRRLTASGSATTEGFLTLTSSGQYLAVPGYDAALGTAAVAGTTSATVNRVVGRVDFAGTIDTTTAISDSFSAGNPRGATGDGTNFWVAGSNSGVRLVTLGSSGASTSISTTSTNLRVPNIFGGQLYISSGAGTIRMGTVGTGTPTATGQTITNLPGFPATPSATGYFFADLNAGVAGVDTLYVADDSAGQVQKYSLVSGTWAANGSITAASARGLTGSVQGTTVTLFGTLGSAGTTLYKLVDSTGYNATISGSIITIASAGINKAFRGVAFAPSSGPPNQAIVPNCPASLNTVQGVAASTGVSASDPDGTVTSASITSAAVPGITLDDFTPAGGVGGTASATLNVSNATAAGTYNVTIQYQNNDSPTPQTATCTVVVTVTPPNQPITPSCPGSLNANQGSAGSANVSASDPDGTVTSASITSAPVAGITLDSFTPAGAVGGTASATLNVANTTAVGTYNVDIQWTNNDSPTPQTANCTVVVTVQLPPGRVVISQVYGGGGNTGSTLKNDYIELINHSGAPVNLSGWSVQAFVSTSNSWQVTPLTNFTLQPGQYYLVQESQGAGGTDNLPTPDAIGTIPVSSTSTKVALLSNTTTLTGTCPNFAAAGIVDLVGYGSTDCFEGSGTAPTLSNTTAALRRDSGCFDTDNNAADFVTGAPNPRNTSSPTHDCTSLSAFGTANPSTVVQGDSTTLTVDVAPAQNPTSTGIAVTADLSAIGGSANQAFSGSGSTFAFIATVPANNLPGMKSLPVTITDAQARTASTNILLSVLPIIPDHITISQVYGGGGNSGAPYTNDYVELYNPTAATVSVTGWSLQYGSATGTTWTNKQPIGGYIEPGQYYLVSLASGGANGAPLPVAPNISGDINMAAGAGKIALVRNSDSLSGGGCPLGTDPDIVDFVGYGTTANCHEGNANAPAPSNTTAIFRKNNGATDTDQNGNDFLTGAPNPRRTAPIVELGPWVAGTDPGTDDTTIPYDASVTVNFSEPVNVDAGWYNIMCATTGAHTDATEAHTTDLKTYAITPNASFQFGEQCTVTIFKTAVHDQDTDDGDPDTDTLFADYTWSFTVVGAGQAAPYPPSVHLTMGNPNNAVADVNQPLNYLMMKPTYALSYNRDKGTPNWVSWHLDNSWYGTLARVDTFRPDPAVPSDWYRVQAFDYAGTGFDRGHMTPNADRDNQNRIPINQETYLMSNMIPQSPDNNQGPWANLEAYLRTLADSGNELYIVSGPNGIGGVGSASGNIVNTVANGHVTVPASTWKVALVIPKADTDDVSRVTCSSRTIAVLLPNSQGIRTDPWENYLTTVDAIEQLTGYDFYSNLPPAVQACVEAGVNGTNPPGTANQSANTTEDTAVTVTLQALQANNNSLTFSIVDGPTSGSLGSIGASSCSGGTCTATVTYAPGADFNGSDSFTFRASDGSVNSNTSTVSVSVTEVNDSPVASDDSKTTPEDTQLSFSSSDLTGNDSAGPAEAGQSLTVTSVTGDATTHGTVTLESGMVTYTPAANFNGPASFTYNVCDEGTTNGTPDPKCATGTVNVTVAPVQDAPDAVDDAATIDEDSGANSINVRANDSDIDGDTLTVTLVTQGTHGSVAITGGGTGVSYTPAANFFGSDSFTYTVDDGNGGTDTATVSITITNVNDAPVANNESYSTNSNTTLTVPAPGVLSNDTDIDSGALSAVLVVTVNHGTLTLNSGGSFSYTPALDYTGPDSFSYRAFDGTDNSNVATVSITINDTVGPYLNSSVAVSLLTATNSNLFNVDLAASATDNGGGTVTISVAVFGDEDDQTPTANNVLHSPDAKDIAPITLRLRGERVEANDGRVYLIIVTATDSSGNISRNYHTVVVPKNNKQTSIDSVNAQAAAAVSYAQAHAGAPPLGYFVIGDGPIIGPKQ
jgi:DNA/RNA endonuclease G (NUC1)